MFRKEFHYDLLAFTIVLCYVLFMTYVFPREWADTSRALSFIDDVAHIIPALNNLKHHAPPYTSYWGMFYAIFWVMAPIFMALGFISVFFLSEKKYKKLILMISKKFLGVFLIFVVAFLSALLFSFVSNFPNPLLNQMSNYLLLLILAWSTTAGVVYFMGKMLGVWYRRSELNLSNSKL